MIYIICTQWYCRGWKTPSQRVLWLSNNLRSKEDRESISVERFLKKKNHEYYPLQAARGIGAFKVGVEQPPLQSTRNILFFKPTSLHRTYREEVERFRRNEVLDQYFELHVLSFILIGGIDHRRPCWRGMCIRECSRMRVYTAGSRRWYTA